MLFELPQSFHVYAAKSRSFLIVYSDLTVRTEHGASNTRIGIFLIIVLSIAEYWSWSLSNKRTIEHVVVDTR